LARKLIENGEKSNKLNFPDDDTKFWAEEKSSNYIGVSYNKKQKQWRAYRWSKNESKKFSNGIYKNEETAARASDTLAKKLSANGENVHKLNFPDDDTEVHPKKKKTSNFYGVSYYKKDAVWVAQRWSKHENKTVFNGSCYKEEETAAHASDTLARKLIANGEKVHKLNFPDDDTEVHRERKNYLGVTFQKRDLNWRAQRYSKKEKKTFHNGTYTSEETAAHASDTLVRKLMAIGEKEHKLNFPDNGTEVHAKCQKVKRKRYSEDNKI